MKLSNTNANLSLCIYYDIMTMPVSEMLVLICICFVHRYLFIYRDKVDD